MWLGPAAAAAAATAIALIGIYHDDRVTAERYRSTLEQADGTSFQAGPLRDGAGSEAGVAFAYQGRPSWMLVTVDPAHRDEVATAEPSPATGARFRSRTSSFARTAAGAARSR